MSYTCEISFKEIRSENVYDFLVALKPHIKNNLQAIAKDNYLYSPMAKFPVYKQESCLDWAKIVFTYRYFYLKDYNLLGIYGVPNCVQHLFDSTIYFQDATDQDYSFDVWKDVKLFNSISDKWKNCTIQDVLGFTDDYSQQDLEDTKTFEYAIKTCCYSEIWNLLKTTLFNDDSIIHISLFGYYDVELLTYFIQQCDKYIKMGEESKNV